MQSPLHFLIIAIVSLAGVMSPVLANLYIPQGGGTTLAPLHSVDIAMDDEKVLVEQGLPEEDSKASAVYTMRNLSDQTIATRVAFPFREPRHDALMEGNFRVTMTDAQGNTSQPKPELIRQDQVGDAPYNFGAAFVWPVTWEPHEIKAIRVEYTIGELHLPERYVDGWRLSYIVSTGAFWNGPIGRAEFVFRFSDPSWLNSLFDAAQHPDVLHPGYSYADQAERISPTEIRWVFNNWIPHEDVWVGSIRWVGLSEGYRLHNTIWVGNEYQGARIDYDDAMLEAWVDQQLSTQRSRFPEQTRAAHAPLKAWYAQVLSQEILARNGDPFIHGRAQPDQPEPPDALGTDQHGYYISYWRHQFEVHGRYHGEWYKPGSGRGEHGSVIVSDLTQRERQNLTFLRAYFSE